MKVTPRNNARSDKTTRARPTTKKQTTHKIDAIEESRLQHRDVIGADDRSDQLARDDAPRKSLVDVRIAASVKREDIEAFFDRAGLVRDETYTGIVTRLVELDAKLVSKFLKRIDALRKPDADDVIREMRMAVFYDDGAFSRKPQQYVESKIEELKRKDKVDPKWRALGAMPVTEVPELMARVDDAIARMLNSGFGYLSKEPDAHARAKRIEEGRRQFVETFGKIDSELRGELIARLATWPQRSVNWLVQHAMLLKDPSSDELKDFEQRWRRELKRPDAVVRFEDAAGYESVGSHFTVKNYDEHTLVDAALAIIKRKNTDGEYIGGHVRHAVTVLCETTSKSPAVDDALRWYAANGAGRDRQRAVFGLAARGAKNIPWDVVLKAAKNKHEAAGVLVELRALFMNDAIEKVPASTLKAVVSALPPDVKQYPRGWIEYGQPRVQEFVDRIGLKLG